MYICTCGFQVLRSHRRASVQRRIPSLASNYSLSAFYQTSLLVIYSFQELTVRQNTEQNKYAMCPGALPCVPVSVYPN